MVLEEVEVAQAVALLESGYTQRTVAESFDLSRSRVAWLWRRYQETRSKSFKSSYNMQFVNGYPIKQYVTGYKKGDLSARRSGRGPVLTRQNMHDDISVSSSIRTGDCRTGAQFCSRMKADFI